MLLNDIRYAIRTMRRAPTFTSAVLVTIALAIAANTTIFSVVYAVMLRPLPYTEPQRLVQVAEKNDKLNLPNFGASVLNFLSWREQTHAFERLARGRIQQLHLDRHGRTGAVERKSNQPGAHVRARRSASRGARVHRRRRKAGRPSGRDDR